MRGDMPASRKETISSEHEGEADKWVCKCGEWSWWQRANCHGCGEKKPANARRTAVSQSRLQKNDESEDEKEKGARSARRRSHSRQQSRKQSQEHKEVLALRAEVKKLRESAAISGSGTKADEEATEGAGIGPGIDELRQAVASLESLPARLPAQAE